MGVSERRQQFDGNGFCLAFLSAFALEPCTDEGDLCHVLLHAVLDEALNVLYLARKRE